MVAPAVRAKFEEISGMRREDDVGPGEENAPTGTRTIRIAISANELRVGAWWEGLFLMRAVSFTCKIVGVVAK